MRIGDIARTSESIRISGEFVDVVRCLMQSRGKIADAIALAKAQSSDRVAKAIEGTVSSDSPSWGSELASLSAGFLETLTAVNSVYDTALLSARVAPLQTRLAFFAAYSTGFEFAEGGLKRVSEFELDVGELPSVTVYGQVVLSGELVRLAGTGGRALLRRGLEVAVVSATDFAFVNAIITAAGSALPSSNDPTQDFAALISALTLKATSRVLIIAHPDVVKNLSMRTTAMGAREFAGVGINGGQVTGGVTLIASDQIAADTIAAIDASQLVANRGVLVPQTSNAATIDLNAGEGGGANVVDLFARNLFASKLERHLGFVIPSGSAAAVENVSYSAPSGG